MIMQKNSIRIVAFSIGIAIILGVSVYAINKQKRSEEKQRFELVKLPYSTDALEPVISKQTVEFHHGKHLAGYVATLNSLIKGTQYEELSLVDIVKGSEGKLFNQAGQTLNHNLYFLQFNSIGKAKKEPTGILAEEISKIYGSFDEFKKLFEAEGTSFFGSGWCFLTLTSDKSLKITKCPNAGNPVTLNETPLLAIDLWEHSYYLDYQNRKAEHLSQLWKIIDWKIIEERFEKALQG